jgi:predicted phosphate transport protein (TIGR00153 family)
MLKWILPKELHFFDFFETQIAIIADSARQFLALVSEGADSKEKAHSIKELEHQADQVAHQCIESLHKTFITPFERNDIYRLVTKMDDIIDDIEEAAQRIQIYQIDKMTTEVKEMAALLVEAIEEVEKALRQLRYLKNTENLKKTLVKINILENRGDAILREALARLFREENDMRSLMKWKEIYEYLENALDRCEDVADIIESVILEMS